VSWLLLGIDDLGMQLEQPYTVMALKQFCEDVQVSLSIQHVLKYPNTNQIPPKYNPILTQYSPPQTQDEVVPETGDSDWTPRIGAPREDVVASAFLNSELTSTFSDMALVNM
jgi:hypothetical protein